MERLSFKWWVGLIGPKSNLPTLINRVTGDFMFMGPFFLQVNTASEAQPTREATWTNGSELDE